MFPVLAAMAGGGAALGAGLSLLAHRIGSQARAYRRREMREILRMRQAGMQPWLSERNIAETYGPLAWLAEKPAFGRPEMRDIYADIGLTTRGIRASGMRQTQDSLAAMGVRSPDLATAIQEEMRRTQGIAANLARSQAAGYALLQNLQMAAASRQAFGESQLGRWGTTLDWLNAGV